MGPRSLHALLALIVASGFLARQSPAEGLSGYVEANFSKTDTKNLDASGQATKASADTFTHRYTITLDKRLYPNLGLLAGGFFEKQEATREEGGAETDSSITKIRPFASINLRTPLYSAEAAYNRSEEKQKSSGLIPVTTVRETLSSTLYWRPYDLPDVKLEYFRTESFDKDRRLQDSTEDRFGFTTQYRPGPPLYLRYQASVGEREDRLNKTTVDDIAHNGKITYSDRLWRRRVSVNSDYSFVRNETKTAAGGGGEVGFPLFSFRGLSAISNVPETVALVPNALLIDGNLGDGAGIDIGRRLPGDDASRNIGLDFATDREVNTLLVTVDRDVTPVADAFSWRVFTSADNLNWTLRQTVFPAVFNPFFARFEIRFANVTARFVKVVVAPLSPAVPLSNLFPTILVTELQAEVRRPAAEITGKQVSTTHFYNLDIRTRILENPSLVHEFSYFLRKTDPSPSVYTISNGLAFQRQFSKVFSGRARFSREDGKERDGTRVGYLYTASVAADPYETLRHSLVFSGSDETVGGTTSTAKSLFLYNSANLYEGIDANFGGGLSHTETGTGRKTEQAQVNASATLVPHRIMTFNLTYTGASSKASGGDLPGERKDATQSWEVGAGLTPVTAIYLFGSHRIEEQNQGGIRDTRTIRNYIVNWSPLQEGTLHLNLFYNESFLSDNDTRSRSIVPSLRWKVSGTSYLELSYQFLKTESLVLTTEARVVSGTFHIGF